MLPEARRSQRPSQEDSSHQQAANGRRHANGHLTNGQASWQNSYNRPSSRRQQQQQQPTRRASSSPSDATSSSSDDREEMARSLVRRPAAAHPKHWPAQHDFRGTLRSTRSVPALALATWDGEPCPVHGHGPFYPPHHGGQPPPTPQQGLSATQASMRRFGSMFDVRPGFYPGPLERKSLHGSVSVLNVPPLPAGPPPLAMGPPPFLPPPHLMPPMMRPRPYVFPAEPLPTRDPFRSKTPVLQPPKMEQDYYSVDQVCCKGHLVVLWIILAVVTIGVILGIILGVTVT